jgi:hypothetical protein
MGGILILRENISFYAFRIAVQEGTLTIGESLTGYEYGAKYNQ